MAEQTAMLAGVMVSEDVTRFDRVAEIQDQLSQETDPEKRLEITARLVAGLEPDARFTLSSHPNVMQQLVYQSTIVEKRDEPMYPKLWRAAQLLIIDWECPSLPDYKTDLYKITSPQARKVIEWASLAVWQHINDLEVLPKV